MTSLIEYYRKKEDTDTNSIIFERVKEADIKICERSLDEVVTILQGLDLEKMPDIQTTTNKEKIGLYTEDEIMEYMTSRDGSFLGRSMYDAIFEKIHTQADANANLKQALNRIREYIKTLRNYHIQYTLGTEDKKMYASEENFVKDILQITNEALGDEK